MIKFSNNLQKKVFLVENTLGTPRIISTSLAQLIQRMISGSPLFYSFDDNGTLLKYNTAKRLIPVQKLEKIEKEWLDKLKIKWTGGNDVLNTMLVANAINFYGHVNYRSGCYELAQNSFYSITDAIIAQEKVDDKKIIPIKKLKDLNLSDAIIEGQNVMIGFDMNFPLAFAIAIKYGLEIVFIQEFCDSYKITPPVLDDTPYEIGLKVKDC